ncbi:histidinol dehydrogenase [uncultured Clostridium sp.]|uniref:histidinol dehydrogenase n=1 Tax=uncultured Clostridium sp. TaxID=59620 RepID=UPI002618EE58|nr:histidinol dehydrogenase [uncultured Clostridium sp.]
MIDKINYSSENKEKILEVLKNRKDSEDGEKLETVKKILEKVKEIGDEAVQLYTQKFDTELTKKSNFKVEIEEIDEAYRRVSKEFIENIKRAKRNIEEYHNLQNYEGYELKRNNGVILGQRVLPIERVGVYVPGGTAAYPSTVLMNVIPAKIAGVKEIIMITPPDKKGNINPYIAVTAHILGVDKIYKVGGAQGIGALAYGTETIERVHKIVGPGNTFVALAKREVFGEVDIDMIAGPSEVLIIGDENTNPKYVAADLMSQAEHDILASAVLVTTSQKLADMVIEEINNQIVDLSRGEIIKEALKNYGKIILCKTLEECFEVSNHIAPEHLEILLDNPEIYLNKIKNAGSVFLGEYSPEPVGDYFGGTNHVLPTSGTAKFSSPLSVDSFIKKSSYIYYSKEALIEDGKRIIEIANVEGLTAHGNSIKVRLDYERNKGV